jgi:magnesium transporter
MNTESPGTKDGEGAKGTEGRSASNRIALALSADGKVRELAGIDLDEIDRIRKTKGSVVWVDLTDPTGIDLTLLETEFEIHPLALEDLRKRRQRPKVDLYGDQCVIVAYEAGESRQKGRAFELKEHHLFAGERYVVSVHWGESAMVESVRARFRQRASTLGASAGWLVYALLDEVADGYFPLLDEMAERIDDLEERVVQARGGVTALRQVLLFKRELLELRRVLGPMRDVANGMLRRDNDLVEVDVLPYFQDLYDHFVRILDQVDLYRDLVASTLEANLAVTSNSLNAIMKRLTAFTVLLMVPTLIAGIYGMNFHFMPELSQAWGYPVALLAMVVSVVALGWFFRRNGWF